MKSPIMIFAVMLLSLVACSSNTWLKSPVKLYFKKIVTPDFTLEWYYHSLITSNTPDVITVRQGGVLDTLCRATNVSDVNVFASDSIVINFIGSPRLYATKLNSDFSLGKYNVTCNTIPIKPPNGHRPIFKDEQ